MCGRYALHANPEVVALQFHLDAIPPYPARYNIAPAAQVLVVKPQGAVLLKWGWRGKAHNLRAETAPTRLRCLVPASGFYEWRRVGAGKQPYYVRPARDPLFGFAGIWDGETCAILTLEANQVLAAIHHRMPAIIGPQDYVRWLGGEDGLLAPAPDAAVAAHPVGPQINSGAAESAQLIEPLPSGVLPQGASRGLFGD